VKNLAELLEHFHRRGVALVSVAESLDTGSAAGRLVLNIMTAVSQWEREAIGERTHTALLYKKATGKVYNHVPYGFVREGDSLLPLAEEQAIVGRIRGWRASGWALRRIAEALNGEGVPTKRGGRWFAQSVSDIAKNTLYQPAANAA
jgi:DNA invertase Pin-like site-specific DNA recombinase